MKVLKKFWNREFMRVEGLFIRVIVVIDYGAK